MLAAVESTPEYKQCPDCAEQVLAAARKCRYCGYRFDTGRRERRWLLADLIPGLRRPARNLTLDEQLAEWGVALGEGEEVQLFRLAEVDGRTGYLLVTSRRLAFFAQTRRTEHELAFEHPLEEMLGARVAGKRPRRRVEVSGTDFSHVIVGPNSRDLERLARFLALPWRQA